MSSDSPNDSGGSRAHALGQRDAVEILHRQIDGARRQRREIFDLDDVLVADRRRRPRLLTEARHRLGVRHDLGTQQLEREALVDVDVLRLVDLAHAAFADEAHHAIAIGENLPDEIRAHATAGL